MVLTWASPGFCSGRARCGSIPTAPWPPISRWRGLRTGGTVNAAEVVGAWPASRRSFDDSLRDPARDGPLAAVHRPDGAGRHRRGAGGRAMALGDERLGRLRRPDGHPHRRDRGHGGLPDFDPNARPRPLTEGRSGRQPAVQPGGARASTNWAPSSKTFTIAQALDEGGREPSTICIDTRSPMRMARGFAITDFRQSRARASVAEVFTHSSNIGTSADRADDWQHATAGLPWPSGADGTHGAGTGRGAQRPAALPRALGGSCRR